ncbi:HepT-like ribonuclease domain-containing protein [Siccirubricoccus phaeus]|uniref:HepT-like ribonuclease domain-containing protein n=1 Tax=Siccirubricoccus phaeus TaxID=2595053 RepID=UPI001F2AF0EB|nr:HepT-like ribonuclease domain-containing protein [Siccirubricoccus phaeus]
MSRRSPAPWLADILDAIARMRDAVGDASLEEFEADWQRQWLVERRAEIVSEASRHLPPELKARGPDISGRRSPALVMSCGMTTTGWRRP